MKEKLWFKSHDDQIISGPKTQFIVGVVCGHNCRYPNYLKNYRVTNACYSHALIIPVPEARDALFSQLLFMS